MRVIWDFIFRRLPIVKMLDGKKTTIGALLTIAGGILDVLSKLAVLYPEQQWISDAAGMLSGSLVDINELFKNIGLGLLTVGLIDKKVKSS